MNTWPAGTHLVLELVENGVCFFAVGKSTTFPGKLYKALCTNFHGNTHSPLIPHPEFISTFF